MTKCISSIFPFLVISGGFLAYGENTGFDFRKLQLDDHPPCRELDFDNFYFCPTKRYCAWDFYSNETRQFLRSRLRYTRRKWNYDFGRVNEEIEYNSFEELNSNQTSALEAIGFEEDSHDCCHNHYISYDWSELSDIDYIGVKTAWELIGYNEQNWMNISLQELIPPYDDYDWDELPIEVRNAARAELCYSKEIWDGEDISSWTNIAIIPGTYHLQNGSYEAVTFAPTTQFSTSSINVQSDIPTIGPSTAKSASPSVKDMEIPTEIINEPSQNSSNAPSSTDTGTSPPTINADDFQIVSLKSYPLCREKNDDVTYFCPIQRYCEWDHYSLNITNQLVSVLKYNEESWNFMNQTNKLIELVRYSELGKDQRTVLEDFGFNEDMHDCCQSHYKTFEWLELFTPEYAMVASALVLLGYDNSNWKNHDNNIRSPLYDDYAWDDLPTAVQFSAKNYLCYTKEIWDKVDLPSWPEDAIIPGSNEVERVTSSLPSQYLSLTVSPSTDPMTSFSSLPTTTPSSKPSALPTMNPSSFHSTNPSSLISLEPSLHFSDAPSSGAPTPESCRKLNPNVEYFCPVERYCEWSYYDINGRQFLQYQIGYDPSTWNYLDIHPIELTSYENLSKNVKDGLKIFAGFDKDKHDCCHVHFSSYEWKDFEENENLRAVKEAYIKLGYDQFKWDNGGGSIYDDFDWDELPPALQTLAYDTLCYSRETWNQVPLTSWPENALLPGQRAKQKPVPTSAPSTPNPTSTSKPTVVPCREIDTEAVYFCPVRRYCEWDYFNFETRQVLTFQIGYTKSDWNYNTINDVETTVFVDLDFFVRKGLEEFGFNDENYECCMNHYSNYDWSILESKGMTNVLTTLEMIGYDSEKWRNGENSVYDEDDWDDIPEDVREMLSKHLCYNRELWNGVPLPAWPMDALLPGNYKTSSEPISSSRRPISSFLQINLTILALWMVYL